MKKFFLFTLMIAAMFASPYRQTVVAKTAAVQRGSITGVVIERDRANGDPSLGITIFDTRRDKSKPIDKVTVKLPFKAKGRIGYKNRAEKIVIYGRTLTVSYHEPRMGEERSLPRMSDRPRSILWIDGAFSYWNGHEFKLADARLDYPRYSKQRITNSLKKPLVINGYSKGKKVATGKIIAKILPKVESTRKIVTLPGQISPGQNFTGTLYDPVSRVFRDFYEDLYNKLADNDKENLALVEERKQFTDPLRVLISFILNGETIKNEEGPSIHNFEEFSRAYRKLKKLKAVSRNTVKKSGIDFVAKVPKNIPVGTEIKKIIYRDRFGEQIINSNQRPLNRDLPRITSFSGICIYSLSTASQYGFAGQTFRACGCFEENSRFYLDIATKSVPIGVGASSGNTIIFNLDKDLSPGEHTITYLPTRVSFGDPTLFPGKPTTIRFTVLKVNATIDQSKLWKGQSTDMRLQILGTRNKLPIILTNITPRIINMGGGDFQSAVSSGGAANVIIRKVTGIKRGDFDIRYALNLPGPCDGKEK